MSSAEFFLHSFLFWNGARGEGGKTTPRPLTCRHSQCWRLSPWAAAGPAQPDGHPHVLSCPWSCLVLTSLVAEQLRKLRVREVTSSTQSYGWWQSRAEWVPRLNLRTLCFSGWPCFPLQASDFSGPLSITGVSGPVPFGRRPDLWPPFCVCS